MYESVLVLLKFDLSIRNNSRDEYLLNLIGGAAEQLASYGVVLDIDASADDAMFLSDWCAFAYRNRLEGKEIPKNLRLRLNDRIVKRRSKYVPEDSS